MFNMEFSGGFYEGDEQKDFNAKNTMFEMLPDHDWLKLDPSSREATLTGSLLDSVIKSEGDLSNSHLQPLVPATGTINNFNNFKKDTPGHPTLSNPFQPHPNGVHSFSISAISSSSMSSATISSDGSTLRTMPTSIPPAPPIPANTHVFTGSNIPPISTQISSIPPTPVHSALNSTASQHLGNRSHVHPNTHVTPPLPPPIVGAMNDQMHIPIISNITKTEHDAPRPAIQQKHPTKPRKAKPRQFKRKRDKVDFGENGAPPCQFQDEDEGNDLGEGKSSAEIELASRRRKHNEIESRRRKRINTKFTQLRELTQSSKPDRGSVLMAAIEKLQEFERKQSNAQAEIARLEKEVQDSRSKIASIVQKGSLQEVKKQSISSVSSSGVDYREIFLKSEIAMGLARTNGQFIDCNVAFETLTGFSRSELLTTNMFALTHPSDLPNMFNCVREMLAGMYTLSKAVTKWVHKNGELFKCSCMISVISDPKSPKLPKYFVCFGSSSVDGGDVCGENNQQSESSNVQSQLSDGMGSTLTHNHTGTDLHQLAPQPNQNSLQHLQQNMYQLSSVMNPLEYTSPGHK